MPSPQLWFVPVEPPADALPQIVLSQQEQQWAGALPAARRQRFSFSRSVMRRVLSRQFSLQPQAVPLCSPPGEPPRLAAGFGSVSLSHAGGALLIGWSPRGIGVDLEPTDRRFDARSLMQRFFPPAEQRQLAALEADELRQAVLRSWLVKEAAIKWRHRSLAEELKHWTFDHPCALVRHGQDGLVLKPREGAIQAWRWAAVGEELEQLQVTPLTWPLERG